MEEKVTRDEWKDLTTLPDVNNPSSRYVSRGNNSHQMSQSRSQEPEPNGVPNTPEGEYDSIYEWYKGYGYDFSNMDSDWLARFRQNPYYRTYYALRYQRNAYQSGFSSAFNNAAYEQKILEAQTKALEWANALYTSWRNWQLQLPSTQLSQYRDAGVNPAFADITAGNVPEENDTDFPEGLFSDDSVQLATQSLNAAVQTIAAAFSSGVSLAGVIADNAAKAAQKGLYDSQTTGQHTDNDIKELSLISKIDEISSKLADDLSGTYHAGQEGGLTAYFRSDAFKAYLDVIPAKYHSRFQESVERNFLSQRQHADTLGKSADVSENQNKADFSHAMERNSPFREHSLSVELSTYFEKLWELQLHNLKAQQLSEKINNHRLQLLYQNDIDYFDAFARSAGSSVGTIEGQVDSYIKQQQKELQSVIYQGRKSVFDILQHIYKKAAEGSTVYQGLATTIGAMSFLSPSIDYKPGSTTTTTDNQGNSKTTETSGGFGFKFF